MRRGVAAIAIHGLVAGAAALTLLPLLWMVAASLMPAGEATALPPRLWPSAPTLAHYRALFTRLDLARNAGNSLLIATLTTGCALAVNSLAGYALAKLRLPQLTARVPGLKYS